MEQESVVDPPHPWTPRQPSAPWGHLAGLDGLRGLAIALVMFHHFTLYGGMRPVIGVDQLYYALGLSAWWGVDLFFVLSGFLITGILIEARGGPHYFRSFYARRSLRIFPLYYGALILAFWIAPSLVGSSSAFKGEIQAQSWYWTYLANFRIANDGWPAFLGLAHFWSLAVEEQFYLLWPAVVLVCDRRTLARLCLGLIVGVPLLRTALTLSDQPLAAYVLMPARMDALALGALLAVARYEPVLWAFARRWAWPVGAGAAASLAALFLVAGVLNPGVTAVLTIGFTLTALLSASLLVGAVEGDRRSLGVRMLASRPLRFLGRYSYGLYIFHHLLVFGLAERLRPLKRIPLVSGSQIPGQLFFLVVATGVSLAVAVLSWRYWEEPFLRLKRHFPYGSRIGQRAETRAAGGEVRSAA
jgi:peptidoglycan/LPS O-acetylase OafA/YrhL